MPDTGAPTVTRNPVRRWHIGSGPGAADLAVIAIGGGIGSLSRYLLSATVPVVQGLPWAIFAVNVSGSLVLGR